MTITELPQGTVTLLKSGQVISTVHGSVKELIENSLDAGATAVEIRLEDFGFGKLEVKDNGHSVEKTQVPAMVLPHTTSKIREFDDLILVDSYGFRGEALAALCSVSKLKIRTKVKSDVIASTFSFNSDYSVQNIESQAGQQGTTVTACDLFHNLPVRKSYYKDHSRKKEEIRKVERLVQSYCIIYPQVRFSLYHNKVNIFAKIPCDNISKSCVAVLGHGCKIGMVEYSIVIDATTGDWTQVDTCTEPPDDKVLIYVMIPKKSAGMAVEYGRTGLDKTFIFVNKRPVQLKEIEKLLKSVFSEAAGLEVTKYPTAVVSIQVGKGERANLDANLEPNKQKISLACLPQLVDALEQFLRSKYFAEKTIDATEDIDELNDVTHADINVKNTSNETNTEEVYQINNDNHEENERKIEEKSCFTMIGQTQPYEQESKETLSQFFPNPAKISPEVLEDSYSLLNESDNSDNYTGSRRARSPVLKAEMFKDPELPGVDAVYLNRLKDGDFTDIEAEEENDDDQDKPYQVNSFINFESEDMDEKENVDNRYKQSINETANILNDQIDVQKWATGRLGGGDRNVEPTKLYQAPLDKKTPTMKNQMFDGSSNENITSTVSNLTEGLQHDDEKANDSFVLKLKQAPNVSSTSTPKQPEQSKKRKLDETTPKIDMFMEKAAKKLKENELKAKLKTVEVGFDMKMLEHSCHNIKDETTAPGTIGSLLDQTKNIWMYYCNDEIHAVSALRIKERMIHDRLITSFPVPFTKLSEPIVVHPGALTVQQSSTLLNMFINTRQCPARITDRRLTFNGFDLAIYGSDESMNIKLEGRNTDIPYYGLADLQETLDLVAGCSEDSVARCRPATVKKYLLNQARRIISEGEAIITNSQLKDLLIYRDSQAVTECPHQKPVSICLKELS